jgi:hypothetical protein
MRRCPKRTWLPSSIQCRLGQPAARSSLSAPRATTRSASSGNGRCSAFASSQGARIQTSRSSSVVRITGMALGCIGSTIAFGEIVRNPYDVVGPGISLDLVPRSPLNSVQIPAKANNGRLSFKANQTTSFFLAQGLAPAHIPRSCSPAPDSDFPASANRANGGTTCCECW